MDLRFTDEDKSTYKEKHYDMFDEENSEYTNNKPIFNKDIRTPEKI